MISFNVPPVVGKEYDYVKDVIDKRQKLCGDGEYTKKCSSWLQSEFGAKKALLTTSCTHALEMAALLIDIRPGDEVIMPSFTFVSTANAFVLRGAAIVFVDVNPDTMNIDENIIREAITEKTKAIVPVHYAGVACNMDKIMEIAQEHNLYVIEDAAQGVMSEYKGKALGTIGHIGCYSFHETKNYTMGEGGAILINDESLIERAEIIREKGTNRAQFFRGMVDKYSWVDVGSSYLPSEINAAFLLAQLEEAHKINTDRLQTWNEYNSLLKPLEQKGVLVLPTVPEGCKHNAHMYYIKCKDLDERTALIKHLKDNGIQAVFHYVPLHSAKAGIKYCRFYGQDRHTTKDSERLLRLPMYYGLEQESVYKVCTAIKDFYK